MFVKSRRNRVVPTGVDPSVRAFDRSPDAVSDGEDCRRVQGGGTVFGLERLRLEASEERLRRLVFRFYDGAVTNRPSGLSTSATTAGSGDFEDGLTICLRLVEDEPSPLPAGCTEQWTGEPPNFSVRFGEQLETTVDIAGGVINGWVCRSLLDEAPETVGRLLVEGPLAAVRAGNGWQAVHAATLIGPAGAVVIRGPSDSGKSTLAAAAWKAGYETLGDESVLVRRSAPDEVVASVREVLVRPWTAEALDLDGESFSTSRGEPKVRLALQPIPASGRSAVHAATVLLGAIDRPGGARLTPLDPSEFRGGFAAGEIPQERWYGSPDSLVRDWARRPAYRLDGAVDLAGAVVLLGRLCQGESL